MIKRSEKIYKVEIHKKNIFREKLDTFVVFLKYIDNNPHQNENFIANKQEMDTY